MGTRELLGEVINLIEAAAAESWIRTIVVCVGVTACAIAIGHNTVEINRCENVLEIKKMKKWRTCFIILLSVFAIVAFMSIISVTV